MEEWPLDIREPPIGAAWSGENGHLERERDEMKKRLRGNLQEKPAKQKLLRRIFVYFVDGLKGTGGGLFIGAPEVEKWGKK